jgi:hypothetical protein
MVEHIEANFVIHGDEERIELLDSASNEELGRAVLASFGTTPEREERRRRRR